MLAQTRKRVKKSAILCLWILAFVFSASAAPIDVLKSNGNPVIKLNGPIQAGMSQSLEDEINKQAQNANKVTEIRLNSEYGSQGEAAKIAVLIKHFNLNTYVSKNDRCFDACLIVLSSGAKVNVENGAAIGLHGIKEEANSIKTKQDISIADKLSQYRRFGVSNDILLQALNKPKASISWFTPDNLRQMGVEQNNDDKSAEKKISEVKPQRQRQFAITPAKEAQSPRVNRLVQRLEEIPPLETTYAWQDYYNRAITASNWQNSGKPEIQNRCNIADFTGSNWCSSTLYFETENDEPVSLQTITRDGLPVLHEVCQYTDDEAVTRNEGRCFDWDRSTQYLEAQPYGVAALFMKAGFQRKVFPNQQAFAPEVFLRDLFGVFQ